MKRLPITGIVGVQVYAAANGVGGAVGVAGTSGLFVWRTCLRREVSFHT